MNLGFLDKSPHVTPLLVQLYDSQKLHKLAEDEKPLARAELTNAVVELLEMDVSPREMELISDVLVELLRQSELNLRKALSVRLSQLDNAPFRVVLQIANDEIAVAAPVLEESSALTDLDLVYIIKSQGAEYWRAIANRKALTDQLINVLSNTRDIGTCVNLLKNESIKMPRASLAVLKELSESNHDIRELLSVCSDLPLDVIEGVIDAVAQNAKVTAESDLEKEEIKAAISDIKIESGGSLAPSHSMIDAADKAAEQGQLTPSLMIETLRNNSFSSFVALFSKSTGLPHDKVEKIIRKRGGRAFAIVSKAVGVSKNDFVAMFLLTNGLRSADKMADVQILGRVTNYYNSMDEIAAQKVLEHSLDDFLDL
jgi:uncharacterized protein (DUF2336 family)